MRVLESSGAYTRHRLTRKQVTIINRYLTPILKAHCNTFELAGSWRRGATDIGDMDYIITDADLSAMIAAMQEELHVHKVARQGDKIATIVLKSTTGAEAQVEFVNVPSRSVGAALLHSTGSGQFNVGLRTYARQKGYLLNQYALSKNGRYVAGRTEEEVFKKLTLHYIPPKDRNNDFWSVKSQYKIRE